MVTNQALFKTEHFSAVKRDMDHEKKMSFLMILNLQMFITIKKKKKKKKKKEKKRKKMD